jgi:hypothetical protein
MPKYFYNGKEFSEDELSKAAEQSGLTIDEYISKAGIEIQQEEVVQEDFQTDPAKETASAGSKNQQAVDTASPLEDGSSGSTETKPKKVVEITTKQGKNTYDYEEIQEKYGDVEAYVKKFRGKAKILELGEMPEVVVTTKKQPKKVSEILTQDLKSTEAKETFFKFEEEEGQANLENLFKGIPGLSFEQTSFIADDKNTIEYNAIKIKYLDPKTKKEVISEPIVFDTTDPEKVNKNIFTIESFIDNNMSELSFDAIRENLYIKKFRQEQQEQIRSSILTPEFNAELDSTINESVLEGTPEPASWYINNRGERVEVGKVTTQYKNAQAVGLTNDQVENALSSSAKDVDAIIQQSIAFNPDTPALTNEEKQDKIKKLALANLKVEAKNNKIYEVNEQIISENKDLQSVIYTGNLYVSNDLAEESNNSKKELEINANEQQSIINLNYLIKGYLGNELSPEEIQQMVEEFASLNVPIDASKTDLYEIESGSIDPYVVTEGFVNSVRALIDISTANQAQYVELSNEQNNINGDIAEVSVALDASAKNYDLHEKYATNIGLGFADIGVGITYLGGKTLNLITPNYNGSFGNQLDALAVRYGKTTDEIRSSYVRDVSFDDAFADGENFGKFAMQEISNQIPILTSIMLTGGAATYVIGASSAGGKMMDMQTEIANGTAEYSDAEIWLSSLGYGAAEAVFERLTTIPILQKAKNTFVENGFKEILETSSRDYAKSKYKGLIFDPLLEAAGEMATTGTQNLIDGKPFVENLDHSGFSGYGMGLIFSGIPFLKGTYSARFSDYKSLANVRKIENELTDLSRQLNNAKSKEQVAKIEDQISNLQKKKADVINQEQRLINDNVNESFANNIILVTEQQAQIQNQAKEIFENKELSQEAKNIALTKLKNKFDNLAAEKQQALSKENKMRQRPEFILLKETDPNKYQDLTTQAEQELILQAEYGKTPTPKEIERRAYDIYLKDIIVKNNNQAAKVEGAKLIQHESESEAIKWVNENIKDESSRSEILEAIKGPKSQVEGWNFSGTQHVIVENQVKAQLTQIGAHEVGHYAFNALVNNRTNSPVFDAIADQLLRSVYQIDKKLYDRWVKNIQKENNTFKSSEVISRFLELVADNEITFRQNVKAKGLAGLFGVMIQKQFKGEYDFDFKGENDIFNFVVGMGKKIANGTLTIEDIAAAKEGVIVKGKEGEGKKVEGAEFSQTKLTEEDSTLVGEQVTKIKELQKEGEALAEKYGKDFIKSSTQTRLEQKLTETIKPALNALAENTTKRLYDRIAPDAKRNVSRAEYLESLKADWTSMIINEYDPTKQSVEKFLSTRGNLRANSLAKKLGIEDAEQGGIKKDVTEQKDLMADETTVEVEKAPSKLIDPTDLITNPDRKNKYIEAVKSKIKDLTPKQLSFKALKDLAPEVTAELFGVPLKKIIDATANLSKGDALNAQIFINKNAEKLLKLLPEGAVLGAASDKLIGTSTGVPKKLLEAFYDKNDRIKKGAGLSPFVKKKNISKEDFLNAFGIVDGKKDINFNPRSGEAQAIKGLMSMFGNIMTNTVVRQEMSKQPGTEAAVQDIAAGKSDIQFSQSLADIVSKRLGFTPLKIFDQKTADLYLKAMESLLPFFNNELGTIVNKTILSIRTKRLESQGANDAQKLGQYIKDKILEIDEVAERVTVGRTKISSKYPTKEYPSFVNAIKNNSLEKYNKKHKAVFNSMWRKINDILSENKDLAPAVLAFLENGISERSHPVAMTDVIGYQEGAKYEGETILYEHAKPVSDIISTLMEAALDPEIDFEEALEAVNKQYYIVAFDKTTAAKVDKAGYKTSMPKGSKFWWQRYLNDAVAAIEGGIDPSKVIIRINGKLKTLAEVAGYDLTGDENAVVDSSGKLVGKETIEFSKTSKENKEKILNKQFNDILQNKTGIASGKEYSDARAEVIGASKGKFNWFIPPTAEDFVGLLYQFLGKGKEGDKQMAWFKVNLLNPYARAMSGITRERVSIARNYRALKKELKIVPKNLKKKVPGEDFTVEQALRVHIWGKQGYDVPGLDNADRKSLNDYINSKPELVEFADKMILLNKDYAKPKDSWLAGTLTTDMLETLNTTRRAEFLKEWQENVDVVFSDKNLNKIEAAYGSSFRYALENILTRMKTGRNRSYGTDSLTGRVTDWLTNSIGAIMFFNTRSAVLQTISAVNFINFGSNNILAAGKAFANQKQFWADFKTLYNSDFLVDRRDGLRLNVNESDIADMAKNGGVKGVVAELLKLGFTPTQIADSFAISSGGATFYRNTLNQYLKEGVDPKVAEELAFREFREIAEESQQSSRPDRISAQQAGPLGRIILAFANTPAQYARLIKKAASDLKNGRGDAKTNVSKLIYYGVAQNLIFNAMQQALFAMAFGDDEEEEETEQKKYINVANGMSDSILRGMGISGAIVSVLKNTAKKLIERSENKQPDYAENALMELLKISPPVSSKASKIKNALRSYEWDKDEMYEKGLALDNPAYLAAGNVLSAATNIPLDRVIKKVTNVKDAMDEDVQLWQRIAMIAGWQAWELGIKEEKKSKSKGSSFKSTSFKSTKFK